MTREHGLSRAGGRTAVVVVVVVAALALGFLLGRITAPAGDGGDDPVDWTLPSADAPRDRSDDDGRAPGGDDARVAAGAPHAAGPDRDDAEPDAATAAPAPEVGEILSVRLFDPGGELIATTVAAACVPPTAADGSAALVLVPEAALAGAASASVIGAGGSEGRVTSVALRFPGHGLVLVATDRPPAPWPLTLRPAEAGDRMWVVRPAAPGDRVPTTVRGLRVDRDSRLEMIELATSRLPPPGALLLDEDLALAGVVVPGEAAAELAGALPVHRELLVRGERLGVPLAEYRRLFFEGTAADLLKQARRQLAARRFDDAVTSFRAALAREPSLIDEVRDELLAAHRGRLLAAPLETRPQLRLERLREALQDLPLEAELLADLGRAAAKLRLFEEALDAWERAWRLDAGVVPDISAVRGEIYLAWAVELRDGGRIDEALVVLERALSQVRDDAELWMLYGRLLLRVRSYHEAADALREAVALDARLAADLEAAIARAERFAEGPGKVVIDYPPGSRSIRTSLMINGRATGDVIIDTGATTSMIPEDFARRAGLDTSHRVPRVRVRTAGNERVLPLSPAGELRIGGLAVSGVSVIVGDLPGMDQRGLLGMDFLGRFVFENDAENGRFVISEKR